jgi:hypothetical protein
MGKLLNLILESVPTVEIATGVPGKLDSFLIVAKKIIDCLGKFFRLWLDK